MFKKVLVANRGEIAVRIIRTCRDMGIRTVALYDRSDRDSLHVRLADECVQVASRLGYLDSMRIIQIAREVGAEAIHPGYGFLSERSDFVIACEENDIAFVGPPSSVIRSTQDKTELLVRVEQEGIQVPPHSATSFGPNDLPLVFAAAESIGYPLVVKSCVGGRGHSARLVGDAGHLEAATAQVATEACLLFGDRRIYLEAAVIPARLVEVQILGDKYGSLIHLGTRDGSLQRRGVKVIAEAPAPFLSVEQEEDICADALKIGKLLNYCNAGTVEFLVDGKGRHFFTEIKARIQVEHPTTELVTNQDIVRRQLEVASGEKLPLLQKDVRIVGSALLCRINAEDPLHDYMPSPGRLRNFRMPGGPNVRVDAYGYAGCQVPVHYEPLLAKITVWGSDRQECLRRMHRALTDTAIKGVRTNIVLHKSILDSEEFSFGKLGQERLETQSFVPNLSGADLREIAVAAAVGYVLRNKSLRSVTPERLREGWRQSARSF